MGSCLPPGQRGSESDRRYGSRRGTRQNQRRVGPLRAEIREIHLTSPGRSFPPSEVSSVFHILNYRVVAGVNDANVDETMTTDTIYTARNGHLLLTEPMNMIGAMHLAASATPARFNIPSWNNLGSHQIWPVNRSATPPSYPRIDDYTMFPKTLPMNEEIAIEESNNLGAATEETTTTLWLAPPNWSRNLPRGMPFGEG